jgi:hypothetical protein
MSLESAAKVLEVANTQAGQESKETATNSLKTSSEAAIPMVGGQAEAVAPTPITEAPVKTEEAAPTDPIISTKFAALAKKEKAIVKRQEEFKLREAEFAKREADIIARETKSKESDALWETDIFKALESRGYTYQKLTDMILSGKNAPEPVVEDPVAVATKTIEAFKKEMADKEAAAKLAQDKAAEDKKAADERDVEEAYEAYRTEVKDYVSSNAESYELISLYGQEELVIDTVQGYYDTHKRVLSVKEASDMVENYLLEEAQKALKTKKLAPKATEAAPKKEEEPVIQKTQSKTLNNNMMPTAASFLPAATDADRLKRAMAALNRQ